MLTRATYNALLPLARLAARGAARFNPKLRAGIEGRRGFRDRWNELSATLTARPVWFHVSSVGEFEQARPIITGLGRHHGDLPVVLTFSSPSGYQFARRRERIGEGSNIVFIDYLPEDTARNMRFCFEAIDPRLLVLVKFDLWPNLVWTARDRGVPTVLVDATLSGSSRRFSGVGRRAYRSIYSALDRILAISDADAERFRASVPGHGSIAVAGDTRFDRVLERWEERHETRLAFDPGGRRVVIAGSTWPQDEKHLLPALARLLASHPDVCAVLAPHEPAPDRVASLVRWAGSEGLSVHTTTGGGERSARVAVIDTVGILAEAYRIGTVAYVGGSFSSGVHSVLEPAIAGLPVLFGPVHDNSFEALQLIERGAAFEVRDSHAILQRLEALLGNDERRISASTQARSYVESRLGATAKCLEAIDEFL